MYNEKDIWESAAKELSTQITAKIDFDIISDMLREKGGVLVTIKFHPTNVVLDWVTNNCKGAHYHFGNEWCFERTDDATFFKLKWG